MSTDENSIRAKHTEDCDPPPVVEHFTGSKWRNGRNDDAENCIVELNDGWRWHAGESDGRCESRAEARRKILDWCADNDR